VVVSDGEHETLVNDNIRRVTTVCVLAAPKDIASKGLSEAPFAILLGADVARGAPLAASDHEADTDDIADLEA